MSHLVSAAPQLDNVEIDPKLKGFIPIPDTGAMIRFGGFVKLDFIHDFKPASNPDLFCSVYHAGRPNARSRQLKPHCSRISNPHGDRSPHRPGDLRILYEGDFLGSNGPLAFNLRQLYGQLDNFLIRFTFSTFLDPRAFGKANTLAIAVERPYNDIAVAEDSQFRLTTPFPDFTLRYRYEGERGHLQLSSVSRSLGDYVGVG